MKHFGFRPRWDPLVSVPFKMTDLSWPSLLAGCEMAALAITPSSFHLASVHILDFYDITWMLSGLVVFSIAQDCPANTRGFVGHRHESFIVARTCEQVLRPS